MGVYIKGITKEELIEWVKLVWPYGDYNEHTFNNVIDIPIPHGDLKDFSKLPNWHVSGLINDPKTGEKVPAKCKIIFESDWDSVPTLIAAEEQIDNECIYVEIKEAKGD